MSDAITLYQHLKYLALQVNHRQMFSLQGDERWCYEKVNEIIEFEKADYTWCGDCPSTIKATHYSSLLGQTVSLLILNMHSNFDANMFAAAEGSVKGGSVIILILPLAISDKDYFLLYIEQCIKLHQFPRIVEHQIPKAIKPHQTALLTKSNLNLDDQTFAIQHIIKTVKGHRRRPLVLTANRGRGKSSALGIAAAMLINDGLSKILVCAPNKQSVNTLYKHAQLTLKNDDDIVRIQFIAPDALVMDLPECDLLIIDEAAAIPIKLLTLLTKHYSRLVFSTTQFGYEGSGRGFALRFQKQLNSIAPQWREFKLEQPIRWAPNDPVEAFTYSSLCLIEEKTNLNLSRQDLNPDISIISSHDLLLAPSLLNQVFSLLVNAHYQTKPSDLVSLLNDSNLTIVLMQHGEHLLAVGLINNEGGFDKVTAEEIYLGKRRPNGHLIAQSFTFHSGFEIAATHKYARIQRIAVQPNLQNKGLGHLMLTWMIHWAKQQQFDHICASFGGTVTLLRFWLSQQFHVLRIGTRKDKSSGEYSIMVNLPLSKQGAVLHQQMQDNFNKQIKIQLCRQLSLLDSSLVVALWPQIASNRPITTIKQSLSAYINGNRGYESIEYVLIDLITNSSLDTLSSKQKYCIIEKIIQNHSWAEIVSQHGFTGQKQAQAFLKNCISDLLTPPALIKQREQ